MALYTNISHEDGIQKVKEFLKKHDAPQAEIILVETLLEHILKKNYFEFNNEFYLLLRCVPFSSETVSRATPLCVLCMS